MKITARHCSQFTGPLMPLRNKPAIALVLFAAWLGAAGNLPAGLIPITTSPTTNMGSGFATNLLNTVNGSGLVGGMPSLAAQHLATIPPNSWVSSNGILSGFVQFDFGASYDLDGFSFWNQNAGGPGALGSTGIKDVSVSVSTNGTSFVPLIGAPAVFAQVPGSGPVGPQMFSFPPITASFLRFNIRGNYGDLGQTGFAEAQFSGIPTPPIPEPGTLLTGLLLLGICGAGPLSRRRATAK